MNYTSIEQSKKLLELGLDDSSADCMWEQHNGLEPYVTVKPYTTLGKSIGAHAIPCWPTDALLQALPFECNLHAFNTECGKVYRLESFKYQRVKTYSTPIEAVFDIVVVYLENPEPQLYQGIEGYGFEQEFKWINRNDYGNSNNNF